MKSLNFLLVPFILNNYDLEQLENIRKELIKLDHSVKILNKLTTEDELSEIINDGNFDCIFRVNGPRPRRIKKNVRFITWYQDFFYDSKVHLKSFNKNDIVYFYASAEAFGVKEKINCYTSNFYPGINDTEEGYNLLSISKLTSINKYQNIDLSLLGAIPSVLSLCNVNDFHYRNYPINQFHNMANIDYYNFLQEIDKDEKGISLEAYKEFICDLQNIVELNYKPLSGELEVFKIAKKIKIKLVNYLKIQIKRFLKDGKCFLVHNIQDF